MQRTKPPTVTHRLVSLKNTISKQLPNMPREYIARLVMDRRHRSCAIVARNGTVLGGITYRPFHAQVCLLCMRCTPSMCAVWPCLQSEVAIYLQDGIESR